MARKSRKNAAAEPIQMPAADRIYKAGLYARISVETERKREADTIGNQLQSLIFTATMIYPEQILFDLSFRV